MSNKQLGFGMTAELNMKKAKNYDPEMAREVMTWISDTLEFNGKGDVYKFNNETSMKEVEETLKSGMVLGALLNVLEEKAFCTGKVHKFSNKSMPFVQMENIGKFVAGAVAHGCDNLDMFQTADLYEGSNITAVLRGISSFGRKVHACEEYKANGGPTIGPEEAEKNERTFTDEQLRAGDGVIGLQAGSNKGASQAGQNFGKSRAIID